MLSPEKFCEEQIKKLLGLIKWQLDFESGIASEKKFSIYQTQLGLQNEKKNFNYKDFFEIIYSYLLRE